MTDRVKVSAFPVQGNPSNMAVTPEGRANNNPREKNPKAKRPNEVAVRGCSFVSIEESEVCKSFSAIKTYSKENISKSLY